jgi:hypothetical protein
MFGDIGEILSDPGTIGAGVGYMVGGPGGAVIGSQIGSGFANREAQKDANEANLAEAQRNRDFQKQMDDSKYARMVADLKQAGINPMLAYTKQSGSAPAGSMAKVEAAKLNMGEIMSSALQTKRLKEDINLMEEQKKSIKANAEKAKAEAQSVKHANEAMKQDAQFYKENPMFRKAKKIIEMMGTGATSAAGLAGAGLAGAAASKSLIPNSAYKNKELNPYKGKSRQFKASQKRGKKLRRIYGN